MKKWLFAAASFVLVLQPEAVQAGNQQDDSILIVAPSWVQDVGIELDQRLRGVILAPRSEAASGIVRVRFETDVDGYPINVRVFHSTANSEARKVAVKAVERLEKIREVPRSDRDGQTFQANIVFASSATEFDALRSRLSKMEDERFARSPAEKQVIALAPVSAHRPVG